MATYHGLLISRASEDDAVEVVGVADAEEAIEWLGLDEPAAPGIGWRTVLFVADVDALRTDTITPRMAEYLRDHLDQRDAGRALHEAEEEAAFAAKEYDDE